jgi:hypothetical protein
MVNSGRFTGDTDVGLATLGNNHTILDNIVNAASPLRILSLLLLVA